MQLESEDEMMKIVFKKSHAQRIVWRPHSKIKVWQAFFCVNDNGKVNGTLFQIMSCILCYNSAMKVSNTKTKSRKILISYLKTNQITTIKKHVDAPFSYCKDIWGGSG